MAGGNEQKITDARGMMTNALIGFVILLAAWLMVDTIMKTFLKDDFLLGPWNEIECVSPVERVDVEDALVSSENWDTTPAPTPPGIMNLEMLPFWPELKHTRQYYGDRDVDNYFAAGTSLVIKLPDYIDQNRGLVILTFTDNKYATVGELSTSRDSGGEVLARLEYGFDNYSLGYTITPADAGKVIYFNYRPSFPPSEIPWLAQIHMSFYPTRD